MTSPLLGAGLPASKALSEFLFSYRCCFGAIECRIVLRARDGRYVSSLIVFETQETCDPRLALAFTHLPIQWENERNVLARDLMDELFDHVEAKDLCPSVIDRDLLDVGLAEWISARRQHACDASMLLSRRGMLDG